MAESKRIGGGRQVCPIPREFGFPVLKGDQWDDTYDLIRCVALIALCGCHGL